MMTNPECVLLDNGQVKFVGTLEEAAIYLEGYADAVIDVQFDEYLDEQARRQALSDWLSESLADDDFSFVPDEVSLGEVVDAASVDPDDQDNTAAYTDVVAAPWTSWADHANPAHEYAD